MRFFDSDISCVEGRAQARRRGRGRCGPSSCACGLLLRPLLALLADRGAAALLAVAGVGDDHLLRPRAVGQLDEAEDLRLGALRSGADDDAGLVADDAAVGRLGRFGEGGGCGGCGGCGAAGVAGRPS
ncbi:hypothetical protein [Nannocystis pusilla]|uniref:hypothetical protein n=1 Tax=Nannocystis pusilla TaxID=889268 RepID=UPI003B76BB34